MMRLFLVFSAFFIALMSNSTSIAQTVPPQFSPKAGTIVISGEGKISAIPDMAYITTGVISIEKNAREALLQNSDAMSQLIIVLQDAGIENKDIQTSNFSISPQYSYNNSSNNQPPKIANYRVSNSVTIIVRDLDVLGNIIDQVVSVGANSINSVSFAIDDKTSLLNEARKRAMENAIKKAQLYANAANVELGRIMLISEGGGFMPQPQFGIQMSRELAMDNSPTPMQSGELTFRANVSVQWEIEQ